MPCESCAIQFSVFRRKRVCSECNRYYCSACLRRGGGAMCSPCRVLSTRPLYRQTLGHLKVRDLQCFLHHQNISTRQCVEKEDLINLVVGHVNSASYRRRGAHPSTAHTNTGAFSSLKGFTNNINELLNSAFDIRSAPSTPPAPRPPPAPTAPPAPHAPHAPHAPSGANCYNSTHVHTATHAHVHATSSLPVAPPPVPPAPSDSSPEEGARRDTDDCFEIEDLDDAGWEFVTRPAEPLPNDSETLLTENTTRAVSEPDLRRSDSEDTTTETSSLKDEPFVPERIDLETLRDEAQLELLNVKQLKDLLAVNRVDYRGCLERPELLERAKMLWNENAKYKHEAEELPIEECCKICMAAPLECVLLECGHIAACTSCSKQLSECPICRQYVVRAVRFFRS